MRFAATLISFSLLLTSPGPGCYQVYAQTRAMQGGKNISPVTFSTSHSENLPQKSSFNLSNPRFISSHASSSNPQPFPIITGPISPNLKRISPSSPQTRSGASMMPRTKAVSQISLDQNHEMKISSLEPKSRTVRKLFREWEKYFGIRPEAAKNTSVISKPNRASRTLKKGRSIAFALGLSSLLGSAAFSSSHAMFPIPSQQTTASAPDSLSTGDSLKIAAPDSMKAAVRDTTFDVKLSAENKAVRVGDQITLSFTFRNNTHKPQTLPLLRNFLQKSLDSHLDILSISQKEAVVLVPGQTQQIQVQAQIFSIPDLAATDEKLLIPSTQVTLPNAALEIPAVEIQFRSVLPADWKNTPFKEVKPPLKAKVWNLGWVTALFFYALLFWFTVRAIHSLRPSPQDISAGKPTPALKKALHRISQLESDPHAFENSAQFYREVSGLLTSFLAEHLKLPSQEWAFQDLLHQTDSSALSAPDRQWLRALLLERAQPVLFADQEISQEQEKQDLVETKRFILRLANQSGASNSLPLMGVLPLSLLMNTSWFGTAFQWGHPVFLLMLVPLLGLFGFKLFKRQRQSLLVSTTRDFPKTKSLRQKFLWLPQTLLVLSYVLTVLALAKPQMGVIREETLIPTSDIAMTFDRSWSMADLYPGEAKITKFQVTQQEGLRFLQEQKKGANNRLAMLAFDDHTLVVTPLTLDVDVIASGLPQLKIGSGTNIHEAILGSINLFLKRNILDLNPHQSAATASLIHTLQTKGLGAALEQGLKDPQLKELILRSQRSKVIILLSDGTPSGGGDPLEAAAYAKALGVKIYAIGIPGPGFNEALMQQMAELTEGRYFSAADPQAMRTAFQEIDRLQKTPAKVRSAPRLKDYQELLASLALLSLSSSLMLSQTKLKKLTVLLLSLSFPLSFPPQSHADTGQPLAAGISHPLQNPATQLLQEGQKEFQRENYAEALKKFSRALEKSPGTPEIYFDIGTTYLGLKNVDQAERSLKHVLEISRDPILRSRAYYQLGMAALQDKDIEGAIPLFRKALREAPQDAESRHNLELAQRLLQKQQKEGQGKNNQQSPEQQRRSQQRKQGEQQKQPSNQKPDPSQKPQPSDKSADQALKELQKLQFEKDSKQKQGAASEGKKQWALIAGAGLGLSALGGWTHSAAAANLGTVAPPMSLYWMHPGFLTFTAVLLLLTTFLIIRGVQKNYQAAKRLSPGTVPKSLMEWAGMKRLYLKFSMLLASMALLGMAAAGPFRGTTQTPISFGGKDIVLAEDVSYSVTWAEDGRFITAQTELTNFIEDLDRSNRLDRVALLASAGTTSNATLSADYGLFRERLFDLGQDAYGLPSGSSLSSAIEKSIEVFKSAKNIGTRHRVLILISDGGDDHPEALPKTLQEAQKENITIYTIGIGSLHPTSMKVPEDIRKLTPETPPYLLDEKGKVATTQLQEPPLREIASTTGGQYFQAGSGNNLEQVLAEIAKREKGEITQTIEAKNKISFFFLFPAALLLILNLALPSPNMIGRKKDAPQTSQTPGPTFFSLGFLPLGLWHGTLPYTLGISFFLILFLINHVTGGLLVARVRSFLERKLGLLKKQIERNADRLFDLREVDALQLKKFLNIWKKTPDKKKGEHLESLRKDALWR
ncbi:MAG: VWA domain-containing protein, partial [Elusimicrobia bacterium]|nr:VWA domain-containing protein [Elusimicrobiota bacterium]